jgi:hypothetical protein
MLAGLRCETAEMALLARPATETDRRRIFCDTSRSVACLVVATEGVDGTKRNEAGSSRSAVAADGW